MSMDKVTNFNFNYEVLLEALDQFKGFITGGGNNQLMTFSSDKLDLSSKQKEAMSDILFVASSILMLCPFNMGEADSLWAWSKGWSSSIAVGTSSSGMSSSTN